MAADSPIDHLTTTAPEFGAVVGLHSRHEARVMFPVTLVDGRVREHQLRVHLVDGRIQVAEQRDQRLLPASCSERHINGDGSFCLGWNDPIDSASPSPAWATAWWQRLVAFLRTQARAEKSRRWPGPAWPHGDAAVHQRRAEQAATALSPALKAALARDELAIRKLQRRARTGEPIFVLHEGNRVVWSFWGTPLRIINKRRACVCPRGDIKRHRRLRTCGSHAQDLLALADALIGRAHEQRRYWTQLQGWRCCGTMDGCTLAKSPSPIPLAERIS